MPSSGTERVTLFKDRLPNSGTDWVIDESEVVSSSENEEQPIKDSTVRINTSLPPRRTWINKKAQFIFRVGNDTMNEDDAEAMLGRDFPFVRCRNLVELDRQMSKKPVHGRDLPPETCKKGGGS